MLTSGEFADAVHDEENYRISNGIGGISHPWPVPPCPVVIGFEGVGVVEGVGDGVTDFKPGDRVAYGIPPLGSYSEIRNYPADKLLHLPDGLDDRQVAALLMKGMTAHYLLHRTYKVQPGDTILVHAAAGGMGLILCQWAKALGATIVGTVSTEEKAEAARAARDLFKAIGDGILDANINYEYSLKDAIKAHEAIESGTTLGATVLIP